MEADKIEAPHLGHASLVARVAEVHMAGSRFCRIVLKPEFELAFPLSAMARLKKSLNKGHDQAGHLMHFQGLTPTFDDFWQAVGRHCPEDKLS